MLLVLVLLTFRDYAISNDEEVQHRYGELILAYYASGFGDESVFHYRNLYLYGGLFDVVAVLLGRWLPVDVFLIRHLLSALAGLVGIIATWATGRLIAGPRAGLFAAALLAVCGVWYGGMFNHTKDIPFAAAVMGTLYFLFRAGRDFPRPSVHHVLLFGLLLGMALGLRATGLLLVGYAGLLIVLRAAQAPELTLQERARFVLEAVLRLLPAFVIAYALMIAVWPWAALHPLNPLRAIFAFAHFHFPIGTIVFGDLYDMATVPRWYIPVYLGIKLPLLLIGSVLIGLAVALRRMVRCTWDGGVRGDELGMLVVVVLVPIVAQVALRGPAFTGMRHFLFVVPPLAVIAGFGLDALLTLASRRRTIAFVTAAAVVAAFGWNVSLLVRLHPHQHLFFNQLVGGLEGASRRYDTDYWVNVMPEAVKKLKDSLARSGERKREPFTVAVCGERLSFEHEADGRLQWTPDWRRADFFVAPTHLNCDNVLKGPTIARIERLGVQIGVVKDLRGISAEERGFPSEIARSR